MIVAIVDKILAFKNILLLLVESCWYSSIDKIRNKILPINWSEAANLAAFFMSGFSILVINCCFRSIVAFNYTIFESKNISDANICISIFVK